MFLTLLFVLLINKCCQGLCFTLTDFFSFLTKVKKAIDQKTSRGNKTILGSLMKAFSGRGLNPAFFVINEETPTDFSGAGLYLMAFLPQTALKQAQNYLLIAKFPVQEKC